MRGKPLLHRPGNRFDISGKRQRAIPFHITDAEAAPETGFFLWPPPPPGATNPPPHKGLADIRCTGFLLPEEDCDEALTVTPKTAESTSYSPH